MKETYHHRRLDCGVELGALVCEGRRTAAFEIRVLSGFADEPADKLGLARLVEQTLAKGTERRTAQQFSDALDLIGAQCSSGVGRESSVFRCSCLPEYLGQALALYAEMLRTPTFPAEFCEVAVRLAEQELTALEDDPGELARRLIAPHAYGRVLGRHELGTRETLTRITREDIVAQWRRHYSARRMQIAVGGAVDVDAVTNHVERLFDGFGPSKANGRGGYGLEFSAGRYHHGKNLEQEHMLICWPSCPMNHEDFPVERIVLAVLSDGMSSRLFTEVREKQGLVYWVGAWDEHPRGAGMIFLGASTTPARCDQTFATLLREVERIGEDLAPEELDRARVGIIARTQTHGDITRARVGELGADLFQYGRPVPPEEKNAQVAAVTVDDVRRYLATYRRDRLCVLTLGPRPLAEEKR